MFNIIYFTLVSASLITIPYLFTDYIVVILINILVPVINYIYQIKNEKVILEINKFIGTPDINLFDNKNIEEKINLYGIELKQYTNDIHERMEQIYYETTDLVNIKNLNDDDVSEETEDEGTDESDESDEIDESDETDESEKPIINYNQIEENVINYIYECKNENIILTDNELENYRNNVSEYLNHINKIKYYELNDETINDYEPNDETIIIEDVD